MYFKTSFLDKYLTFLHVFDDDLLHLLVDPRELDGISSH